MATRPASSPETRPKSEGLPRFTCSTIIHETAAAAAETNVFIMARDAMPSALSAEPALKPNQPTQSKAPPIMVMVRLCGAMESRP